MIYLLVALAVFAAAVWLGRRGPIRIRRDWRVAAGALAVVAFLGGGLAMARGAPPLGIALMVAGIALAFTARKNATPKSQVKVEEPGLSEARAILGVSANASRAEIQAAYSRLMQRAHPDKGGTSGLAAQLNAARDRLLKS